MTFEEAKVVIADASAPLGIRFKPILADETLGGYPVEVGSTRRNKSQVKNPERDLLIRSDMLDQMTPEALRHAVTLVSLSVRAMSTNARRLDLLAYLFALPIVGVFFWNYTSPNPVKVWAGLGLIALFVFSAFASIRRFMGEAGNVAQETISITRDIEGARSYVALAKQCVPASSSTLDSQLEKMERAATDLGL